MTIAQIEGRVRGAGSEFVLACDMRFAARESAIFSQNEAAFGLLAGGGLAQHLARLMGRSRALEVMLSADDYDAQLAERYGWINRALPTDELDDFVRSLAHRIATFPTAGHALVKDRVNAIALAATDEFRRDSDLFGAGVSTPETQGLLNAATARGFQTREGELRSGPDARRATERSKEAEHPGARRSTRDQSTSNRSRRGGHAAALRHKQHRWPAGGRASRRSKRHSLNASGVTQQRDFGESHGRIHPPPVADAGRRFR